MEMLHLCTPLSNKENILKSLAGEQGSIRDLVATISFGMGVNCKGVSRIIHFGPYKNIENYAQETGRAVRDGAQSIAWILYNGIMLNHVERDMKSYVKSEQYRRKTLMKHFQQSTGTALDQLHLCCHYCSSHC